MSDPIIAPRARADMEVISDYYADKSESFARKLLAEIFRLARLHAQFPLMGRPREDLRPGLRSFAVKPYVVFYRPTADTIEVARVLHGAQDLGSIMKEDEPG